MASSHRLLVLSAAVATGFAVGAPAFSQTFIESPEMTELFQRIERQDKQAAEDGLLLDKSKNARSQDTKLSIGSVEKTNDRPFSLDPTQDPNPMPGFGLNLKMNF